MHTWVDIATLTKKKLHQKRFVARWAANLFSLPEAGMQLAFVPPHLDTPRRAQVQAVSSQSENTFEIELDFDEEWDDSALEQLVGCHVLARRADMKLSEQQALAPEVTGMCVVDEKCGELGCVVRLESYPAQDMLVVQRAEGTELLIPLVKPLLVRIDGAKGIIFVNLPAGFVELSQDENTELR